MAQPTQSPTACVQPTCGSLLTGQAGSSLPLGVTHPWRQRQSRAEQSLAAWRSYQPCRPTLALQRTKVPLAFPSLSSQQVSPLAAGMVLPMAGSPAELDGAGMSSGKGRKGLWSPFPSAPRGR